MTEMSWGDNDDLALSRWMPHLFATLQSDATLRLPTTPSSDILKNHPALAPLLSLRESTVLSDKKYGDMLQNPISDQYNLRVSATPPPDAANTLAPYHGSVASAVAPAQEQPIEMMRSEYDDVM
eukprot:9492123-Pyramimonas_sp.AAC.1